MIGSMKCLKFKASLKNIKFGNVLFLKVILQSISFVSTMRGLDLLLLVAKNVGFHCCFIVISI